MGSNGGSCSVFEGPGRQPRFFGCAQQRHVAHGLIGGRRQRLQDGRVVACHALHGFGGEQLGRVDPLQPQVAVQRFAGLQHQLELGLQVGHGLALHHPFPHGAEGGMVLGQMVQHDLE